MVQLDWDNSAQRAQLGERVRAVLAEHGVVAFPTGSSYGLGVDPCDLSAVERLLSLKGRRSGKPIPLIVSEVDRVAELTTRLPPSFKVLVEYFWPGALSLVLEAREGLAPGIDAGTGTLAIRVPGHQAAREVARAAGGVLTATSANRAGQPACREPGQVGLLLSDQPALLVTAGTTPGAAGSTMLDIRRQPARIVRHGRVGRAALLAVLGPGGLAP
jgi:L-threonylcarbamoyladenylate synthase